ncbi:MAG: hypothetical protein M3R24_21845 [Chloroflexota bacterium]|nr:hypothetical protein [Chloroflexota bacterium]
MLDGDPGRLNGHNDDVGADRNAALVQHCQRLVTESFPIRAQEARAGLQHGYAVPATSIALREGGIQTECHFRARCTTAHNDDLGWCRAWCLFHSFCCRSQQTERCAHRFHRDGMVLYAGKMICREP